MQRAVHATVSISRRFNGPPESGNGGYCCGLLAGKIGAAAEISLYMPPPLDRPLEVERNDGLELLDSGNLVASGRRSAVELEPPPAPSFEDAAEWSERFTGFETHVAPTCFVCGPERRIGDGLRIFPGRSPDGEIVAAPWIPDDSVGTKNGTVPAECLWAALDCPGYFAAADGRFAVLGRMRADLRATVKIGERCVVAGWRMGAEGRKVFAGTALYKATGEVVGVAHQTWVALKIYPTR